MCVPQASARGWHSRAKLSESCRKALCMDEGVQNVPSNVTHPTGGQTALPENFPCPGQSRCHISLLTQAEYLPFKLKGHAVLPGDMEMPGFRWHFCLSSASLLQALPSIYLSSGRPQGLLSALTSTISKLPLPLAASKTSKPVGTKHHTAPALHPSP